MIYLCRVQPTSKEIEKGKGLRGIIPERKVHIFDEEKNNTYCNQYRGMIKSQQKRSNNSIFDDRWRLIITDDMPSHQVCNTCLKRHWNKDYSNIKNAHDIPKPQWR